MKTINNFINESKGWEVNHDKYGPDFSWSKNCSFIWMNTESEEIGFLSEQQVRSFTDEYDGAEDDIDNILSLKPGEIIDVDGGINYYIRFK